MMYAKKPKDKKEKKKKRHEGIKTYTCALSTTQLIHKIQHWQGTIPYRHSNPIPYKTKKLYTKYTKKPKDKRKEKKKKKNGTKAQKPVPTPYLQPN